MLVDLKVIDHEHVFAYMHPLFMSGPSSGAVVIVECLRNRKVSLGEKLEILHFRDPASMRCLVMNEKAERFCRVPLLYEINRVLRYELSCIAFLFDIRSARLRCLESWIIVFSLTFKYMIIIKALRFAFHMPFADYACDISVSLKQFRNEGPACIYALPESALTVLMAVKTGHQTCAGWGGKRIFHISAVKSHTLIGKPVYIRGGGLLRKRMTISAYCLERVIVRHYVYDVRPFTRLRLICKQEWYCDQRKRLPAYCPESFHVHRVFN